MRQISRLLVLLSFISLTSSAQSESAVRTTSQNQSTVFHLPNSGTLLVGFKSEDGWPHINYTVSYLGKEIEKKRYSSFQWTSQWTPLLLVSKEVTNGANPADPQGLDTRYVSLSSAAEVEWQMMTLPLKDHELQKATPGEEVFLDLPEEDDVWVALWNKLGQEFKTELSLFHEQKKLRFLNINASKDWSIICINAERIIYGNNIHPLTNKGLKGRQLLMKSYDEAHFQVFPVPLALTDAAPLFIAIAVVATSVGILGTFFGCRFFWKKRNTGPTEGATSAMFTINGLSSTDERISTGGHFGAVSHPGIPRPSSSHDSENSLYGAVIPK